MKLEKISIYPVKSLRGLNLPSSPVTKRGLRDDRRYMIVDKDFRLITQREVPVLAKLDALAGEGSIAMTKEGGGEIKWRPDSARNKTATVTVWNSPVDALIADYDVNKWIQDIVGQEAYIAYMPNSSIREINPIFNRGGEVVSFADGYPLLLTTIESLQDLNERLESPVPMERFRPNIVVSGSKAFEEDGWRRIRVGKSIFRVTKPCARCKVTTIDQVSGDTQGVEPLRTLASFRSAIRVFPDRFEELGLGRNDVLFGTNLVPENEGTNISVNDRVEIIDWFSRIRLTS